MIEINAYRRGSVSHVYTTSDGGGCNCCVWFPGVEESYSAGFNLTDLDELVRLLQPHVKVVSPNELVKRALQKHRRRSV